MTTPQRLEQLLDLEKAVQEQIHLAQVAIDRDRARQAGVAYPATDADELTPQLVRVPVSHVRGPAIRAWARQNRYDVSGRGRLDLFVVGAFVEAHQ